MRRFSHSIPPILPALALCGLLAVAGCKIVYDGDEGAQGAKAFDAGTFVAAVWEPKVVPLYAEKAMPLSALLPAIAADPEAAGSAHGHRGGPGQPWTYAVKGEGKVTAVDVASRRGTVTVELSGVDGPARTALLQVGPVVFGTALRDSLPFVAFNDFVNQIEFAQVSRSLNDRASEGVRASFDAANAVGRTVVFTGAATAPGSDGILTVTPVTLAPAPGAGS